MRYRSISFLATLLGLVSAQAITSGCGTLVKVGEDSDGSGQHLEGDGGGGGDASTVSAGGGGPGTGGGGPGPLSGNAIALFRSQVPDVSGGGGSSSTSSGGPALDPNDLFIIVGNQARTCADPYGSYACGNWRVAIVLPPALQVPGVLDLTSPELVMYSGYSVSGPDDGSGSCYGGGGSFTEGTIEIVSLDATEVDVRFAGTDTSEFDVNGAHVAVRCP